MNGLGDVNEFRLQISNLRLLPKIALVPRHPIVSFQAKLRRRIRIALRRLVGRRGHSSWATTWWRCQLGAYFFLRTDVIRHSTSSSEPIKVDVDWYWNQFIYVFRFAATYATLFYLIAVMPRIHVLNSIFWNAWYISSSWWFAQPTGFCLNIFVPIYCLFEGSCLQSYWIKKIPHLVELIAFFLGRGDWFLCAAISKL